jgi:hypothetical protein
VDPATGPDALPPVGGRLTAKQRDDLLVAVARRWWWLRLQSRRLGRPEAADDLLDRMVAEHLSHWDPTAASLIVGPIRAPARSTMFLDQPLSLADLAEGAWREARRSRRRRTASAAGVLLLGLLLITIHRQSHPDIQVAGPPPVPAVTVRPPLTDVVPTPERLATLPTMAVPGLPGPRIELARRDELARLSVSPVHRATAVFEPGNDAGIYVLGDDGKVRLLDAPVPMNARLTSTSLSPDGLKVALLTDRQVAMVDLATGKVRSYPMFVAQTVATTIWTSPTTIAVSDSTSTFAVDLTSGALTSTHYVAGDLLQAQPPGPLAELISVDDPPTTSARIRHWAGESQLNTTLTASQGAPLSWLGAWQGPGWQRGGMLVRDAATTGLALPLADSPIGVAGAATLVVDEGSGVVRRVLAFPGDPAAPAVLGFLDPQTVLLRAGNEIHFGVLAWTWGTGELRLVTELSRVAVISLALR